MKYVNWLQHFHFTKYFECLSNVCREAVRFFLEVEDNFFHKRGLTLKTGVDHHNLGLPIPAGFIQLRKRLKLLSKLPKFDSNDLRTIRDFDSYITWDLLWLNCLQKAGDQFK